MPATSKKSLKKKHNRVLKTAKRPARLFIHQYPAKEIKEAILPLHGGNCPLQQLIAVGEATFDFINSSQMDLNSKNAFGHLERLFDFYKNLLRSANKRIIIIKKE